MSTPTSIPALLRLCEEDAKRGRLGMIEEGFSGQTVSRLCGALQDMIAMVNNPMDGSPPALARAILARHGLILEGETE